MACPLALRISARKIRTFNIAPVWTRLLNANAVFTFGGFVRQDQYNYYPSDDPFADFTPDLQSATVGQSRRLTNAGARTTLAYVKGIHNIKIGATYEHTFLTERDTFGLVDPTANAPCLNPDGSADTNPLLTNPANCTGVLQPNIGQGSVPAFIPILACYDLTRTAPLPASDGCPNSYQRRYELSMAMPTSRNSRFYLQDTITVHNWTFNLGVRFDKYNGISQRRARGTAAWVSLTTSSRPTPCCGCPTPAPWRLRSTRIWCWRAWDATIR